MNEQIEKAVIAVGSQRRLASLIGVSPVFVHQMLRGEKSVPAGLCLKISGASGAVVTCHDLRPDVFGEAPKSKKRAG